MHHEHLTRVEDIAHRLLLCRVEPRQPRGTPHGGGRRKRRAAVDNVAQQGRAVAFGLCHAAQRIEHQAVSRLVEIELHAQLLPALERGKRRLAGQRHREAVVLGEAHRARDGQERLAAGGIGTEETDGAAILKVMVGVVCFRFNDFHREAVERVIACPARRDGKPAVAAPFLALDAHRLAVALERRLLVFVFPPQEFGVLGKIHSVSLRYLV